MLEIARFHKPKIIILNNPKRLPWGDCGDDNLSWTIKEFKIVIPNENHQAAI